MPASPVRFSCTFPLEESDGPRRPNAPAVPTLPAWRYAWVTELISHVHVNSRGVYGMRRLHAGLTPTDKGNRQFGPTPRRVAVPFDRGCGTASTRTTRSGFSASGPAVSARRLVIGISGSSAPQLGITVLTALRDLGSVETHLVLSPGAHRTIELEAGLSVAQVEELADVVHGSGNLASSISSGSFTTLGMAVIPCSMRTLAAIATGNTTDLLTRAADVTLKERRRLVVVPRETPLNLVHIRNMETITLAGGTVLPPAPAFYHRPRSIQDLLNHIAGKTLDQFGIEHDLYQRWNDPS